MRFEEIQKKAGVSLVTVLLFMLVATIAATATYKWLTSEGRSSASRMQQNEAYLSALAGIESARSWMTYNANETGAIIGQYKNGNNAPVKLTDLLAPFMRAGQHFDVYLVGVNTENSPYKLKLLSEGTSRNGEAKHSEVAILNVNGLYQVTQPGQHHHKPSGFNYAYYGGSFTSTQVTATSAVVNGNWAGNPPNVTGDWIVTGHAALSGTQASVGGNACIAGYLSMQNAGIHAGNLYAVENFLGNAKVTGNAYFEKDARLTDASINGIDENFKIEGNLTVQGKLITAQNAKPSLVEGNLCIGDDGALVSVGVEQKFTVKGNTWITGDVWYSDREKPIKATGCTCKKTRYTCDYEVCKCRTGWGPFAGPWYPCSDEAWYAGQKDCNETKEYGECSDADIANGVVIDGLKRKLVAKSKSFHYSGTEACEYGNLNLVGCTDYSFVTSKENYGTIGGGKQYEQIILGSSEKSKTYVNNVHSWSDFETLKGIYGDEKTEYVQSGGTPMVYWNQNSGDKKYYPYDSNNDKTGSSDMYYIAKDLDGKTSVGWGSYFAPHYNAYIYAYFINYSSMERSTSYTTSTHSNDDGEHPIAVNEGGGTLYYRYLNGDANDITGSPYCRKPDNTKKFRPICGVNPWFKSGGTVQDAPSSKPSDVECGESVKEYCNSKWSKVDGCEGTSYVVPDPLVTGYDEFEKYASMEGSCAATITKMMPQNGPEKSFAYKMNECYRTLTSNEENKKYLYNGFMVVKIAESSQNYNPAQDTVLIGNYIIIVENELLSGQQGLPNVADDRYVFLYLKKGAKYIQKEAKNYFIYTLGDIGNSSGLNLTGSIYAPAKSCANARFQDSQLTFSEEVLSAMESANILCKNEDPDGNTPCGGPVTPKPDGDGEGDGDGDTEYSGGAPDKYYISVAPQLSVTLESQYKNNESAGNVDGTSVDPSFIVLPRIIYLTKDAKGQLSDYYNIVPLNAVKPAGASSPVSGVSVNGCNEISSGPLGGELAEKIYTCEVQATVNGKTKSMTSKVPFWVIVSGTGGSKTAVSFVESDVQLAVGNDTPVELTWEKTTGAGVACKVVVSVSDHSSSWEVGDNDLDPPNGNKYTININTSEDPPKKLFDVHNAGANEGGVIFLIEQTEGGCAPGAKPAEAVYNINNVVVRREGLAEYCAGPGLGTSACNAGGEYQKKKDWPDCSAGDVWVNARRDIESCKPLNKNNSWSCTPEGTISLMAAAEMEGCEVIVPAENNAKSQPFPTDAQGNYEPITLYAAAKAVPQKLKLQFDVTGDLAHDQSIYISVDGTLRKTCKYGEYLNNPAACELDVFNSSIVKLSFNSDPEGESNPPGSFNYWLGTGPDCNETPLTTPAIAFEVSGSNTVEAHFGESDKHCFFDEFKDEYRNNRASVECNESNSDYCIQTCDEGSPCGSVLNGSKKWRLMEGSMDNIEYSDGRISLKSKATRGKKESEKSSVRTVVMSTAQAGKDGELKAQFQVPEGDAAKATVKNSGFILRSDASKNNFLMLNIFATDGKLKARLCVNGQDDKCHATQTFSKFSSIASTDIVMMSARFAKQGENDVLRVKIWPNSWAKDSDAEEVVFTLTEASISGVSATAKNEYVGYSLADPNFKLYGIGWKSDTYNAQCWDTPPTISCSFKAAYAGGIVPLNESVLPWTGLSAWYNNAYASNCRPVYYYNGNDGGCYGSSLGDEKYVECGSNYQFSTDGPHGYYSDAKQEDEKTAKASVEGCSVTGPAAAWANQGVAAHCGAFWVGKIKQCSKDIIFDKVASGLEGEYYAVDDFGTGVANVRDADLKVFLDNPNEDEVEIYLYSINTDSKYSYGAGQPIYSLPYKTTSSGTITISMNTLSNAEGFDPERVRGVYVKTSGTANVTSNPTSVCGHVLDIESCTAEYVKSSNKWKITTTLKGDANSLSYKHVEKMVVSEASGHISSMTDEDKWTAKSKTVQLSDDNPYGVGDQQKVYAFAVTLTLDEGEPKTRQCTTDPVENYNAVCHSLTGATARTPGSGLPVFSYDVKCPQGPCKYSVVLNDGSTTIVGETTTNVDKINQFTRDDAANKGTPLAEDVEYKFHLDVETPNGNKTGCTSGESFKIEKEPAPSIEATCPQDMSGKLLESTIEITPGGNCNVEGNKCTFILTESGGSAVNNLTPSNGEYVSGNITFKGPTSAGTKHYVLTLSRTGTESQVCNFDVEYVAPLSVDCANVSDQSEVTEKTAVTVTPAATGCAGACGWKVCLGNETCSDQNALAKSNQSNLSDGTITATFTDPNGTGSNKQYNVIVSKDGQSGNCVFNVTYTPASSGSTCNCAKYCGSGCESNIVTGNAGGGNIYSGCVFLTAATRINNNAGYTINGTPITENGNLCYGDEAACASKLAAYEPVDGGWYFKMDNVYTDIISSGYNPCATVTAPTITACPVASAKLPPNGTVRVTPTTTNCNVLGGCSYTILPGGTGDRQGTYYSGDITFKGESSPGGPVEYTISISNSADPTPKTCSFQVTYSASIAATEIPTSGNKSLSAGTHVIKCTSGKVVSCGHYIDQDYNTYSMTIDDVSCPVAQRINWNRCQDISCTGGNQTLVTDRNITCQAL